MIGGQPVTGPLKITGMALQAPSLLPWRTTLANLMLPLEIVEPFGALDAFTRKDLWCTLRDLQAAIQGDCDVVRHGLPRP